MVLKWLSALVATVVFSVGHAPQEPPVERLAADAVQELVRNAIADRFSNRDIPDQGLLLKARSVLVLREMPAAGLMLGPEALPTLPGVSFSLIAKNTARRQADTTGQKVFYVVVDRPAITGTTATLWLGVDFEMPSDPKMVKLCCCSSEAHFEKRDGQWHFAKWGNGLCS